MEAARHVHIEGVLVVDLPPRLTILVHESVMQAVLRKPETALVLDASRVTSFEPSTIAASTRAVERLAGAGYRLLALVIRAPLVRMGASTLLPTARLITGFNLRIVGTLAEALVLARGEQRRNQLL